MIINIPTLKNYFLLLKLTKDNIEWFDFQRKFRKYPWIWNKFYKCLYWQNNKNKCINCYWVALLQLLSTSIPGNSRCCHWLRRSMALFEVLSSIVWALFLCFHCRSCYSSESRRRCLALLLNCLFVHWVDFQG